MLRCLLASLWLCSIRTSPSLRLCFHSALARLASASLQLTSQPSSLARKTSQPRPLFSLSSHPENPMQFYRQEGQFVSVFFPLDQALDRLVPASSHIAASSPPAYLPCRLQGVLPTCVVAVFFLRGASRLDAFSVYPVRTSLPSCALGRTTVAPVVRPFRSSRTRNSSSHDSYAHDG